FPLPEQTSFLQALQKFYQQLHSRPEQEPDVPAATFLEPRGQWNALINAVSTYANGAELDRVSTRDVSRYDDSGGNWRVVDGDCRQWNGLAGHARPAGANDRSQRTEIASGNRGRRHNGG